MKKVTCLLLCLLLAGLTEYSARDCAPQPLRLSRHSGKIEQARRWR